MRLCANFLWCVPSRWIKNACILLAITASKRRNVLFDSYLFEARLHYFVFLSFPRLPHVPNSSPVVTSVFVLRFVARGPFLERPGNLTSPKSYFEIKFSRKVGCVLTSNEVHFNSLAENFTVQFSNLLKLPSGMENKTV